MRLWFSILFAVMLTLTGCGANNETVEEPVQDESSEEGQEEGLEELSATVVLSEEDHENILSEDTVTFEQGQTLMEVMDENYEITTAYEGAFISGINGIEADDETSSYWLYTINGEEALVGATEYELEHGDLIHFHYDSIE
ncbi:DUF4430 domain-containing protein [Halalkalibacter okhensis]|uniref:Transcobalamin-like C-terminal domain-containing protein n=1 Tax=Halalkalibacter okhensis TaxID=333138 RepID=A0A0B0IIE1_9BACI|nr:DUF4430 domain-containing protein [Halalkalibacter okhensis]KHF39411.1 hypothetical protein LQ50_15225 [Halalkalibacter okhensis]